LSTWAELQAAAPALAAAGRERLERPGVALLGTLRADGSPRISPVEPYFAAGELIFGVMRSAKAKDLARDRRCTLHNSVSDPNGTEGEFKLFGQAEVIEDPELRDVADGWWTSYPVEASQVYRLEIDSAMLVMWNFDTMSVTTMRWAAAEGVSEETSSYP
jgi:Pyridoxamine 5'-phosphate oxidase